MRVSTQIFHEPFSTHPENTKFLRELHIHFCGILGSLQVLNHVLNLKTTTFERKDGWGVQYHIKLHVSHQRFPEGWRISSTHLLVIWVTPSLTVINDWKTETGLRTAWILPWRLTWQWNIHHLKLHFLLKMELSMDIRRNRKEGTNYSPAIVEKINRANGSHPLNHKKSFWRTLSYGSTLVRHNFLGTNWNWTPSQFDAQILPMSVQN